jgi:hypothetical protein
MTDQSNVPAAPVGKGGFAAWESTGMQWLVLGLAPGVTFITATETRALAVAYLKDEYDGETHDYFAIVKARDFFRLP